MIVSRGIAIGSSKRTGTASSCDRERSPGHSGEIVPEIRAWAEDDGRGEVMIFVTDYKMYATVAMASESDALLFRLLFDGQIVKKTTRRRTGYT